MGDRSFDDQEFCLPSEFLTDELILMDKENFFINQPNSPLLPSPLLTESPTESQSYFNNNSFFTDLTRSTLVAPKISEKTLSSVLGNGNHNGRSLVPSPPITPIGRNNIDYWQLKKMDGQGHSRNFTHVNLPNSLHPPHNGNIWGHQQGRFGNGGYDVSTEIGWGGPHVERQNQRRSCGGVDMRVVGYGGGMKRERSAGTGVFLPRRYNTTLESRKKSGCSTTQPPPRVVEAQRKMFENVTPQLQSQRHFIGGGGGGHISENEIVMARRNAVLAQEWRKYEMMMMTKTTSTATEGMRVNNEIRLPQEWTY